MLEAGTNKLEDLYNDMKLHSNFIMSKNKFLENTLEEFYVILSDNLPGTPVEIWREYYVQNIGLYVISKSHDINVAATSSCIQRVNLLLSSLLSIIDWEEEYSVDR